MLINFLILVVVCIIAWFNGNS